jgi:hypothetical protein
MRRMVWTRRDVADYGPPSLPAEYVRWDRMVRRWRAAGVSTRLAHRLANAGCGTIEDTLEMTEPEWLREPGFGRVCMAELRCMWDRRGPLLVLTYGEWRPGEVA